MLLKGKVDVETNAVGAASAAVGSLHHPAAGTCHHFKAGGNSLLGYLAGQLIARIFRAGAGRAEDGDLAGSAARLKNLQGLAEVRQGAADQPPFVFLGLGAGHLQQGDHGPLNQPSLGMALELVGQGL